MWKTFCIAILLSISLTLTACNDAVPAVPYDTVRAAVDEYGFRGMLITPQSGDDACRLAERYVGDAADDAEDWCLFIPYNSSITPEFGVIAVEDEDDAAELIAHLTGRGAQADRKKGFVVYEFNGDKKIIHKLSGSLWTVD